MSDSITGEERNQSSLTMVSAHCLNCGQKFEYLQDEHGNPSLDFCSSSCERQFEDSEDDDRDGSKVKDW